MRYNVCYTCARLSLALIFQACLLISGTTDSQQIPPRTNHNTVFWDHQLNTLRNYQSLIFSPQSPLIHSIWTWCANWYHTELYVDTKHYLLCSLCISQIYSYFTNIIIILMIITFHSMPYTATSSSLIASYLLKISDVYSSLIQFMSKNQPGQKNISPSHQHLVIKCLSHVFQAHEIPWVRLNNFVHN